MYGVLLSSMIHVSSIVLSLPRQAHFYPNRDKQTRYPEVFHETSLRKYEASRAVYRAAFKGALFEENLLASIR